MLSAMSFQPSTPILDRPAVPINRRLWSSPSFSDYFSGEDSASFTTSPQSAQHLKSSITFSETQSGDGLSHRSLVLDPWGQGKGMNQSSIDMDLPRSAQAQRELLARLNAIARAILAADELTEHHYHQLEADIDRLEQTLAAPDSQSRDPAEGAEMGLFDDETEVISDAGQMGPKEDLQDSSKLETSQTIARVTRISQDLQKRFVEMKHVNDIMTTKLEAAASKITRLASENRTLREAESSRSSQNLYFKLQLNALEGRAKSHLDRKEQVNLYSDIEELGRMTNCKQEENEELAEEVLASENSSSGEAPGLNEQYPELCKRECEEHKNVSKSRASLSHHNGPLDTRISEQTNTEKKGKPTWKARSWPDSLKSTAWQQLWDDLADFVGIHDEYRDELSTWG